MDVMRNMKKVIQRSALVLGISVLAASGTIGGHIQTASSAGQNSSVQHSPSSGSLFFPAQTPFQHLATSRLLGASIKDRSGKVIGDIEDLILSTDNRIIGVIMGVGGALGFGEKKIAVRMAALKINRDRARPQITLDASSSDIKQAPAYRASGSGRSLIQRGADVTRKVLKKAARKTSETVAKAKEVTRKAVVPARPAPPANKPQ